MFERRGWLAKREIQLARPIIHDDFISSGIRGPEWGNRRYFWPVSRAFVALSG
jgi:hypothetical protein